MKKRAGYIRARLPEQSGQALILVIVFLLLGSLTLVPLLSQINSALKSGVKYEEKTNDLYAADAGIEDGIWRIKYGGLQALFGTENYEYDFSANGSYNLDKTVNGETTNVTIQNIWIPSNETLSGVGLSADEARTMIDSQKLVTSGTAGAVVGQPYRIKLEFAPAADDNLTIKSVGVWLPQGFTFVSGNSTLEALGHPYTTVPSDLPYCGGRAIVWSYTAPYPLFTSFPNFVSENGTMTSTMYFSYTPPATDPLKMPAGIAWVTTEMHNALGGVKADLTAPENVPISWDTDTQIYKITSIAGGTKVEAYTSKLELSLMGDAASGDYVAVGNSLMIDSDHLPPPDHGVRNELLASSDATVSAIPANGDALSAYLYWSGWRTETTLFTDTCTNFDYWSRSNDGENQTRVPTGDGDTSGTWNTAPRWDDVDETTPNDADYMTGTTDSGNNYQLFSFSAFTIPVGSAISDLTVYVRAKRTGSGTSDIKSSIKVNGTLYNTTGINPGSSSSFNTYSFSYATNPNTGLAWTAADINGTGAIPLQQFGVYSNDLNPDIEVSMVYATVNVGCWTVSSSHFMGQGTTTATTAQRTLTLKNNYDLSSYAPGTIGVYWDQDESGTLESTDTLYYAFSGDGGSNWSTNYEAFHDDDPASPFHCLVPGAYTTAGFKIRFYFNFDSSDESVTVDNFKICNLPPDTSVAFSINGTQVSLDADGAPQIGGEVTASVSSVLINSSGYSYACRRDVTNLVKKYPVVAGEQHHTGNTRYTVGNVQATTGNEISYAGWSLIIVYFSPQTAGHYLYLRDVFANNGGNVDADFDGDGQPGGDIAGFVIPEPIKDKDNHITETNAAKLTVFVGEGDWCYSGDFVALNAPSSYLTHPVDIPNSYKLWDGITLAATTTGSGDPHLPNNSVEPDNVWNSKSIGMSEDGVDIDTFEVSWASQLLKPGDTRLHLDIYSRIDQWSLIYFIISVRSKTFIGGTGHYVISNN